MAERSAVRRQLRDGGPRVLFVSRIGRRVHQLRQGNEQSVDSDLVSNVRREIFIREPWRELFDVQRYTIFVIGQKGGN